MNTPRETSPERFDLRRRDFLKMLGGGVLVLLVLGKAGAQESGRAGRARGRGPQRSPDVNAWLHIGEDGAISVFTGKTEVGQNIRTSLTQVVAEELRAPLESISMVMADTDRVPWDAGTFGSRTTPDMAAHLRKVAAAAREALIDLAAAHFAVERALLEVKNGRVTGKEAGQTATFGELAKGQKLVATVTDETKTMPAEKWTVAGTSVPKIGGRAFVTGQHRYSTDFKLPGMLHGKVLRPSAFDAVLASADTAGAEAIKGVTVVRDENFLGVTAPDPQLATRALAAIRAEWTTKPQPSAAQLFSSLKENAATENAPGAASPTTSAPIEEAVTESVHKLEQSYTVAYIAHVPLEPRAAVAQWENDKLTVWTGTQRPFGVRAELAQAFHIAEDRVRVIVPDTGSGYGGKHTGEAALEAARLAKGAGKPVKLVWTREEEFTWAYFRPAGLIEIKSSASKDGLLTAWEFHNYNSGGSGLRSPYDVANQRSEFHQSRAPLKQGSYRALASTANHFARETHMDELAHAAGIDPLEFRLKNLKDVRLRAVFEAAAKAFGWGGKPAGGHGFGIAGGTEKAGYLATCAEVSVDKESGEVKVVRALSAFECGAIINPDHLKNQIEGSMMMGLGGALFEAIDFADGKIRNGRLSQYRVPRFTDAPKIEVVLLDRKDLPSSGAGEAPIIGIAPAIGNAIFQASGIRLRSLPLVPSGLAVKKDA